VTATLLFANQLGIFFLFGLAATFYSCAALAQLIGLCLLFLLGIFAIDLGEYFLDARIGIGVDEVAEQICQAK
jgi:hypothetical protein